jgi:magnesium-protoporphyrin IX monomethyl ester (oxidative) cyclase
MLHEAMGLHSTEYDYTVFRITSEICRQVFPVEVDIDHPVFRASMDRLLKLSLAHAAAKARGGIIGRLQAAGLAVQAALTFGRLFLLPVKTNTLPAQIRFEPVW